MKDRLTDGLTVLLILITLWVFVGCAPKPLIGPTPKKEIIDKQHRRVLRVEHGELIQQGCEYRLKAADGTYCYVGRALYNATPIGSVVGCVTWRDK